MAVNKSDGPPPFSRTLASINAKPVQKPAADPLAGVGLPPEDTSWLPPAGVARAATLPLSTRASARGVAAPIDADFPHLQPGSQPASQLRETLREMLGRATGANQLGPSSPALQQAVDRLAPALGHTTRAEAEKLIAAELKHLAPDAKALEATLRKEGFTGVVGMTKGEPTAEAFAKSIATRISRAIPQAQIEIGKEVVSQARRSLQEKVPAALKTAFNASMTVEQIGLNLKGFPARSTMVNDLFLNMTDRLRKSGAPAEALASVHKLAEQAADGLIEANVKGLMSKGFTEESARAFAAAPSIEEAGRLVGRAVMPPTAGAAAQQMDQLFAREAKDGFVNLEKNLVAELKMTPEAARSTAKNAKGLFRTELARQRVPRGVMASIEARATVAKAPLANAEGAAKVSSWGEKLIAHVPTKVVELATNAAEAAEKAAAASPMLMKAAPYAARVVPYLNTPVAGLTMAHAADVVADPEAWKLEASLAVAAAGLNVAAAGAAYVPVPVLDWAASFTGGGLSLGVSGLEWGTSALRKTISSPKPKAD